MPTMMCNGDFVPERRILGINFFVGKTEDAVERMMDGGLLVAPAAPALKDLSLVRGYREALLRADLAITDSSFMVMIWNMIQRDNIPRISGLLYLRILLQRREVRADGNTVWIMPGEESAKRNLRYLDDQGIKVAERCVYLAPLYGAEVRDELLLDNLRAIRPQHVIITIGGGKQERLGLYIKQNLGYLPSIHCIGAAIAFLSGDQVKIPGWADKSYLGWLFRCMNEPRRYIPRYWRALALFRLILRYRSELPPPMFGSFDTSESIGGPLVDSVGELESDDSVAVNEAAVAVRVRVAH
jgi:UDP-N-acetyl-D-mannosaminuronic acid transferase (WecB/TagA/CpsF family)